MDTYYAYDADYPMTDDDCADLGSFEAESLEHAVEVAKALWPSTKNIYVA